MKTYVLISLFLVFAIASCRSNKELNKVSESVSQAESVVSATTKDSTATATNSRDSTSDITTEKQYIRTTWYRPDGTIQKVQESGWSTRHEQLAVRDTGSSAVSVKDVHVDSTRTVESKKRETENLKSTTDSRPIQGNEWAIIAIIVCITVSVLAGIILYKLTRK